MDIGHPTNWSSVSPEQTMAVLRRRLRHHSLRNRLRPVPWPLHRRTYLRKTMTAASTIPCQYTNLLQRAIRIHPHESRSMPLLAILMPHGARLGGVPQWARCTRTLPALWLDSQIFLALLGPRRAQVGTCLPRSDAHVKCQPDERLPQYGIRFVLWHPLHSPNYLLPTSPLRDPLFLLGRLYPTIPSRACL